MKLTKGFLCRDLKYGYFLMVKVPNSCEDKDEYCIEKFVKHFEPDYNLSRLNLIIDIVDIVEE